MRKETTTNFIQSSACFSSSSLAPQPPSLAGSRWPANDDDERDSRKGGGRKTQPRTGQFPLCHSWTSLRRKNRCRPARCQFAMIDFALPCCLGLQWLNLDADQLGVPAGLRTGCQWGLFAVCAQTNSILRGSSWQLRELARYNGAIGGCRLRCEHKTRSPPNRGRSV